MHPLRFPNNGISAKVFVRKVGFKLRMMRLNHVELFYAFMLRFRSEGSEEGWPTTTNPHVESASHRQTGYKGQSVAAKAPCKGAATRRSSSPQKHRMLPMASSQGAACPPRGHRGSSYLRPTRIGVAPIEGDAYGHGANHRGSCRWLRAAVAAQGQR
ncbi:hypothetical protein BHE74_00036638 [Ensete ventricosum]|nr:hypothetical protein BHE74_00036638 [Ensete ventricosum]